ncbi:hypothetical protein EDD17DRAFT_1627147 [Pisolithus thermaeus]|nr:hypothetical protein EDD17DRAFT_1627147 [Pisolithus thermaeus]
MVSAWPLRRVGSIHRYPLSQVLIMVVWLAITGQQKTSEETVVFTLELIALLVKGNSIALRDELPNTGMKLVVHGISMEIS